MIRGLGKRFRYGAAFVAAALLSGGLAWASLAPPDLQSIEGFWQPPSGGRIEIRPCGDRMCGHIRDDGVDNGKPTHEGYLVLEQLRYAGALTWADGFVHDPEGDRTYGAKVRLLNGNQLKLTGCLWIFCGSQVWTRIE